MDYYINYFIFNWCFFLHVLIFQYIMCRRLRFLPSFHPDNKIIWRALQFSYNFQHEKSLELCEFAGRNSYEHISDLHSLRLPISCETETKFYQNFTTEGIELDRTNLKSPEIWLGFNKLFRIWGRSFCTFQNLVDNNTVIFNRCFPLVLHHLYLTLYLQWHTCNCVLIIFVPNSCIAWSRFYFCLRLTETWDLSCCVFPEAVW